LLRLRTLGGLSIFSGETPLSGVASRRRSLALLALAASSGEDGISDEHALATLWPDFDAPRGRNNLKQVVYTLRQALGPNVFVRNATTLRIDPSVISVDLWDFERAVSKGAATEAAELYTGPFLDGFHIRDLNEFERWVDAERARLAHLYTGALKVLALGADAAGNHEYAIAWWRKLVTVDQLNDQYAQSLIRALADSGDIAGALQHARIHENLLQQELDVKPGPAFQRLVQEIRQAAAVPNGSAPPSAARPPAVKSAPLAVTEVPPAAVDPTPATEPVAEPLRDALVEAAPPPAALNDGTKLPGRRRVWSNKERRLARFATRFACAGSVLALALMMGAPSRFFKQASGTTATTQGSSVAILPFVDGGRVSASLGPTVSELLATSLDGSLGLHVVSVDASDGLVDSLRGRSLSASRASARRLAVRIRANLYVSGEVVESGDRIRITAELRDREIDDPLERVVAEGERRELFELVDRVASQILASRIDGVRREVVRVASVTTSSLAAAKAYLAAEEASRTGRFRAAIDFYREAIHVDSAFALAYYGLSDAADVLGDDELAERAASEALRHSSRLPTRQKRLLTAYLARQRGEVSDAERDYVRLVSDYPADAEAWMGLAETLFHLNPLRGRPATEARGAFERVVTLDPKSTSAVVHLIRIAALEHDAESATRLVARAYELSSPDAVGRYALHVLSLGGARVDPAVAGRSGGARLSAPTAVELLTRGETDAWRRFAAQFAARNDDPDVKGYGLRLGSLIEAGEGRIVKAMALLDSCTASDHSLTVEARSRLAALSFVPLDAGAIGRVRNEVLTWMPDAHSIDDPIDSIAHVNAHPYLRLHRLGLLSLRLNDTATVEALAKELDAMSRGASKESMGNLFAVSLRARLAAWRGRTREALTLLEGAARSRVASASPVEAYDRLLYAQLLAQVGREDEALGYYRQLGERSPFEWPLIWQAELGMARIYGHRGDRALAARYYRSVATRLKEADATLRSSREEAEQRASAFEAK
jgi:DNA-binding SARP family transcriptional activator/tetratricopeptide (TPR) repeat protein